MKKILISIFACATAFASVRAEQIASPNGQISVDVSVDNGRPAYAVSRNGDEVVKTSHLGFVFAHSDDFGTDFSLISAEKSSFSEVWNPVWGEEEEIENTYNELLVVFEQNRTKRQLAVRFRAYNDGVGFRYEFPEQENLVYFTVAEELTEFAMTGDHVAYWISGDYDTQEYDYTVSRLSEIRNLSEAARDGNASQTAVGPTAVQTALQLKTDNGLYINLHEAALVNYPCLTLVLDDETMTFRADLTPNALGDKAYLQSPFVTPWRTIMVQDDARKVLASRLILNLNEPCAYDDVTWIKPVKYVGVWWEMITG